MRSFLPWTGGLIALTIGVLSSCTSNSTECAAPKLAPNQPNGSSPLASTMVAMDAQLQSTLQAVLADPNHGWNSRTLVAHDLLGLEPTDNSMINAHFEEHAPLYALAIEQFNNAPSSVHFNAVVDACADCHHGTCPGPLERIEKRRHEQD
jgi:hypothetical protein